MSEKQNQKVNVKHASLRKKLTVYFSLMTLIDIVLFAVSIGTKSVVIALLTAVVGIIAAVIYIIILQRKIFIPIENISMTVNELQQGHLNAKCNVKSSDEIGLMASEINDFAANIRDNVIGVIDKISDGDISVNVVSKGEGDMVTPSLKKIISCMRSLSHDTERLITAVSRGNLNERGYTKTYNGSWRSLIESMNTLIDKIATPLNEVMNVTRCLAVNDFTHTVENTYEGSFNELALNINEVRNNLMAMQNAVVGVSEGNTDRLEEFESIGKKSENDCMIPSIVKMMRTIRDLIDEIKAITDETSKGNISDTRGDVSKFDGGYREIIEGVNNTLDTVVMPIKQTILVLDAMAVNDLGAVPDSSVMIGDFEHLGNAIKQVQSNVELIQNVTVQIANGDISALEDLEKRGKLSENDKLMPAFIKMMQSLKNLMNETGALANAAIEGRLEYRSDISGFEGEYANILSSFNSAFHNMAKPIREISGAMGKISVGDLSARVEGEYQGVFGRLSEEFNNTVIKLNAIISKISFVLTNIADGNLDLDEVEDYGGDFSNISIGLNNIINSLNGLLSSINDATDQVASGAKQVSSGSQNLSSGATEQASSVEQLTASITQISSQTKNNAANANEANSLARTTKENAIEGNNQMNEMLAAMNDIRESSSNISKIIKVIDDIAFQTNILALNAAVEAARAGQYGKGFAVVAEEVRNLAARSANAAKDTTNLIEGSVNKIESGTEIANRTAEALSNIVSNIDKVSDLVSNIAAASNEQASGIAQIDKGVMVVSNVVQTNSATAEESAAASEELSSQAEYLREMLSRFKLKRK
jgi:methyl-accepting chemotaxis protein